MTSAPQPTSLTPDEYLAIERGAEFRSEFDDGVMIPVESPPRNMAGARFRHGSVISSIHAELYNQLRETDCTIVTNDLPGCHRQWQLRLFRHRSRL